MFDVIVVGAGASGVFAAIEAKRRFPEKRVAIFEKTNSFLSKVKISGGGRCNVTHHCFDLEQLCANYPRGRVELRGAFSRFGPEDTIKWFQERKVELKSEKDGRMFPLSNTSATIVDTLMQEVDRLGVELHLQKKIERIEKGFTLYCSDEVLHTKTLILATGSNKKGFEFAQSLGHTIQLPIPSLFTFNVPTSSLKHLSGVSVANAKVSIEGFKSSQTGPVLITHFGFSGPAIIKLSAFAAKFLFERDYKAKLKINWTGILTEDEAFEELKDKRLVLAKSLLKELKLGCSKEPIGNKQLKGVAKRVVRDTYLIEGKTTNKEEFVTCGGVSLKEIDFRSMESKVCDNLFIIGELMDVDGVTGGFNFQHAWTSAFMAAKNIGIK